MRSAITVFVSIGLVFLIESVSLAQRTAENLAGIIGVGGGAAFPPVVWLRLERFGVTVQETFLRDRRFEFPVFAPGPYTIVAEAPGFETVNQSVDYPLQHFTLIELNPQRNRPGRPEVGYILDWRIPESARRHIAAGVRKLADNKLEAAEEEFKRALEQPHRPDLHLELGKVYARQGNEGLLARQIELYVEEEKPGPFRDRMQSLLERYGKR